LGSQKWIVQALQYAGVMPAGSSYDPVIPHALHYVPDGAGHMATRHTLRHKRSQDSTQARKSLMIRGRRQSSLRKPTLVQTPMLLSFQLLHVALVVQRRRPCVADQTQSQSDSLDLRGLYCYSTIVQCSPSEGERRARLAYVSINVTVAIPLRGVKWVSGLRNAPTRSAEYNFHLSRVPRQYELWVDGGGTQQNRLAGLLLYSHYLVMNRVVINRVL